jgi:6-pyruvoyltetrahydropterin/6-carboxytetrahydropterin synthase
MFQAIKIFDGFSSCFRQWKAEGTHCKFLHGYAISFEIVFEGELDERNWVWDFGGMKRAKNKIDGLTPKDWFDYMFDHTILLAQDDPEIELFKKLEAQGAAKLRVLDTVGCEMFAKFVYDKIQLFLDVETNGRVKVVQVTCREHAKNSASYK